MSWTGDLVRAVAQLDRPSREDLFVLLVTWLQAHASAVGAELRRQGHHLPLVEPLPTATPGQIVARLRREATSEPWRLAVTAVAAARALDLELGDLDPVLLTGQHAGVDGRWFRVRPRIVPGGTDDLYGLAKDDPTFGVARRMACVPDDRIGGDDGVRLVDGPWLPPPVRTRLALRREHGEVRVLVDGVPPDERQWTTEGGWTQVRRAHDPTVEDALNEAVETARSAAVDMLLLPELALEAASLDHLKALLRRGQGRSPSLVVVGLCHADSDRPPLVWNEAVVLDGAGTELFRHRKLAPFSTGEGGRLDGERLDPGGTVTVLATPVGNVAVLICKDLFDARPEPALLAGYVTWLLVPSLSPKTGPHRDRVSQLRPRRITTVVCNVWPDDAVRRNAGPHVWGGPTLKVGLSGDRRAVVVIRV